MTDRELFILLVGQLVAGGRSHADACEEALNLLAVAEQTVASNQKFAERAAAGVQLGHATKTQRFQSQEPNLSGTAKPELAVEPPKPAPIPVPAPAQNDLTPVSLDGWGVPVKPTGTSADLVVQPPGEAAAETGIQITPPAPVPEPPVAPWANPECKACGGSGYNSKGAACGPCKSKPVPETEKVKAVRGKTGQQIVVDAPKQLALDLSGGGTSAPVEVENTVEKVSKPPVAAPAGQTFSTDYMTCDECPSDKLTVTLLPGDQGEAVYTCQTCGHSEGFTLEPDDLIELKARGKRLPPANRPAGPDGEEVFHRSDAAGVPKPTKNPRSKKALAVSESHRMTANQNPNPPQSSESTEPPSQQTNSEPQIALPEFSPSTKQPEPKLEVNPKIKNLVDDLLSPNLNPSLPVNELLAKAELELVVSGWDKAKLISKWEDLTKKSYSEGMPLGQMADQVVGGMLGVRA